MTDLDTYQAVGFLTWWVGFESERNYRRKVKLQVVNHWLQRYHPLLLLYHQIYGNFGPIFNIHGVSCQDWGKWQEYHAIEDLYSITSIALKSYKQMKWYIYYLLLWLGRAHHHSLLHNKFISHDIIRLVRARQTPNVYFTCIDVWFPSTS